MPGTLSNSPRILHGAFVEYGLSIPPLFVVFQFNPEQLSRNRSLTFEAPNKRVSAKVDETGKVVEEAKEESQDLREWHQRNDDLQVIQEKQTVKIEEEKISFDIRLDATDKMAEGNLIAGQFGIAPQLATLEQMVLPKAESLLGALLNLQNKKGYSYTKKKNPPLVLFIWGRKKVLPVNINSLSIEESVFSPTLNPVRATVSVELTVIEGKNPPYTYSKAMNEAMSVLNLANVADIANVIVPL